nr:caspase-8-like [Misgurnus anguillicaudatus]
MAFLCDPDMKFQQMLLRVQESLGDDDLQDLLFLCSDLVSLKELSEASTATDLFSCLQTRELLSPDDPSLLLELLTIMKQNNLIRKLGLDGCIDNNGTIYRRISAYRLLLFELSQSICDQDLKKIKFMLGQTLPRKKLERETTLLQLFWELEKEDHLDENNVDILQEVIGNVYPALEKRIVQYKEEATCETFIAQETEDNLSTSVQPLSVTSLSLDEMMEDQVDRLDLTEDQSQSLDITSGISNESSHVCVSDTPEIPQYKMEGEKRGICLIINNCNFTSMQKREGTDIDKESLTAVFQWLGFEVWTEQDCDKKQMLEVLKDLAGRDHTGADCVVCCVLTHGCVDGVFGKDGEKVTFRELKEPLQCSSLLQKPKLFFIQACRGTREQRPVWPENNRADEMTFSDAAVPTDSIPEAADFLLAMSTVPDHVSLREKTKGTWFIQALCHNLKQLVPRGVDLLSILTQVNNDVSRKTDPTGTRKQMPQPEFTLTKRVVFPIPKTNPPQ